MSEEKGDYHYHHHDEEQPPAAAIQYGTFQGVANYPQPQPAMGFPHPAPPPGHYAQPTSQAHHYAHGYQSSVPVAEGRPIRERRLPCCGIGCAWFLFIIGFFLAGIPWYIGAFVLLCARYDHREKPGYVACTIAAVLAAIAVVFGLTSDEWD
nr:PREDICTED: 60S ribosomal protein L18a-like protein isoform X2 [Daucus carota subsp. sativus]